MTGVSARHVSPRSFPALQRTACDRCRHHKLKCNRDPNQANCRRCIRAKEKCFTSPARKAGRPHRASASLPVLQTPPDSAHGVSPVSAEANLGEHRGDGSAGDAEVGSMIRPSVMDTYASSRPCDAADIAFAPRLATTVDDGLVDERIGQMTRRSDCIRTLGTLQGEILQDVDMMKGCHTAARCLDAGGQHGLPGPRPDFMIGRILNHTRALLELLDQFDISRDATTYISERAGERLVCDVPALFALMSCYIGLYRTYRIIFAALLESIPFFQNGGNSVLNVQLLPDVDIAGFKLDGRIDLQLQVFVQVSEDLLAKLDNKFGIPGGATCRTLDRYAGPTKATVTLWVMIEQETAEQPPLDEPRGYCESLKDILRAIRTALHMGSGETRDARANEPQKRRAVSS
jgi:hypothetical protein